MIDFTALEFDSDWLPETKSNPLPMMAVSQATLPATSAPRATRTVCRVCGRPFIDGECVFMPDKHRKWN